MLRSLHKFARLRNTDRTLLFGAVVLVVAVRLGLWLLPFRITRQWVTRSSKHALRWRRSKSRSIPALTDAIEIAARRIPGATCLTQALAAQVLLARAGYASLLRIGVLTSGGRLKAHAWVEHNGVIVIGDVPAIGEFRLLPV